MSSAKDLTPVLTQYQGQKGALIPILQQVQARLGYLSPEAIAEIARFLGVSQSIVYGVASFYAQFRFKPQGKHVIKICQGTACHVKGGATILQDVQDMLGIAPSGTTEDLKFSIERVACVGCCALAPVVVIDEEVNANMTPSETKKLISKY